MVDVEYEIFTEIMNDLKSVYPDIYVTGEAINVPPHFPCVSVNQLDSALYRRTFDSSGEEKFSRVTFEINIYSNLKTGKKSQAKEIASRVDDLMCKMGFSRVMLQPIPNIDAGIYRLNGRYKAVVTHDYVYRR